MPAAGEGNPRASLIDGHDGLPKESLFSDSRGYHKNQIFKDFRSARTYIKIAGPGHPSIRISLPEPGTVKYKTEEEAFEAGFTFGKAAIDYL